MGIQNLVLKKNKDLKKNKEKKENKENNKELFGNQNGLILKLKKMRYYNVNGMDYIFSVKKINNGLIKQMICIYKLFSKTKFFYFLNKIFILIN